MKWLSTEVWRVPMGGCWGMEVSGVTRSKEQLRVLLRVLLELAASPSWDVRGATAAQDQDTGRDGSSC